MTLKTADLWVNSKNRIEVLKRSSIFLYATPRRPGELADVSEEYFAHMLSYENYVEQEITTKQTRCLLGLLSDPEDGSDICLRNVS
jgi:hypothetical protein